MSYILINGTNAAIIKISKGKWVPEYYEHKETFVSFLAFKATATDCLLVTRTAGAALKGDFSCGILYLFSRMIADLKRHSVATMAVSSTPAQCLPRSHWSFQLQHSAFSGQQAILANTRQRICHRPQVQWRRGVRAADSFRQELTTKGIYFGGRGNNISARRIIPEPTCV